MSRRCGWHVCLGSTLAPHRDVYAQTVPLKVQLEAVVEPVGNGDRDGHLELDLVLAVVQADAVLEQLANLVGLVRHGQGVVDEAEYGPAAVAERIRPERDVQLALVGGDLDHAANVEEDRIGPDAVREGGHRVGGRRHAGDVVRLYLHELHDAALAAAFFGLLAWRFFFFSLYCPSLTTGFMPKNMVADEIARLLGHDRLRRHFWLGDGGDVGRRRADWLRRRPHRGASRERGNAAAASPIGRQRETCGWGRRNEDGVVLNALGLDGFILGRDSCGRRSASIQGNFLGRGRQSRSRVSCWNPELDLDGGGRTGAVFLGLLKLLLAGILADGQPCLQRHSTIWRPLKSTQRTHFEIASNQKDLAFVLVEQVGIAPQQAGGRLEFLPGLELADAGKGTAADAANHVMQLLEGHRVLNDAIVRF